MRYWCCLPHIDAIYLFYMMLLYFLLFIFFFSFSLYIIVNLMRHRCFSAEVHYCCKPSEAQMFCAEVFITYYLVFSHDGKQIFIPNVWQVVLANVSMEGGVISSDIYGFFYGSSHILTPLPIILMFSTVVVWPVILWCSTTIGDGVFKCSL